MSFNDQGYSRRSRQVLRSFGDENRMLDGEDRMLDGEDRMLVDEENGE